MGVAAASTIQMEMAALHEQQMAHNQVTPPYPAYEDYLAPPPNATPSPNNNNGSSEGGIDFSKLVPYPPTSSPAYPPHSHSSTHLPPQPTSYDPSLPLASPFDDSYNYNYGLVSHNNEKVAEGQGHFPPQNGLNVMSGGAVDYEAYNEPRYISL